MCSNNDARCVCKFVQKHKNEKNLKSLALDSYQFLLSIIVVHCWGLKSILCYQEYMRNQTSHHFSIMVPLWHFTFGTSPMIVGKWLTCHSMDELSTIMPWELICPSKSGPNWWGLKKHWKWIVVFGWPINICRLHVDDWSAALINPLVAFDQLNIFVKEDSPIKWCLLPSNVPCISLTLLKCDGPICPIPPPPLWVFLVGFGW